MPSTRIREGELGDGEPSPPPDAAREFIEARLVPPLLHGDEMHREWLRGELRGWIPQLAALLRGAAQEVSPTCPLCKKSNRFIRQPGTCSHPFHDEPFRKKVEEVSPPSPEPKIADITKISATPANTVFTEDALGNVGGDTRELKAALREIKTLIGCVADLEDEEFTQEQLELFRDWTKKHGRLLQTCEDLQ